MLYPARRRIGATISQRGSDILEGNLTLADLLFSRIMQKQKVARKHTVPLEADVRRSDFVVIFFNWPKTRQPLILKSILDLFNGIQEDYLAKV